MLKTSTLKSHSSVVTLQLLVADDIIHLSHVGPDRIVAKSPVNLPPCEGVIVMTVDGVEQRSAVRLPQGMKPSSRKTPIELIKS